MTAALLSLTGPLQGQTLALQGDSATLGRHPSNQLVIPHLGVSRRHCIFRRQADGWTLTDLESSGGTFVNGIPIQEARLRHGDLVAVGGATLLVSLEDPAGGEESADDVDLETGTVIQRSAAESVYLRPETLSGDEAAAVLGALLDLVRAGADSAALLAAVLRAVPADRGALIPAPDADSFEPAYRPRPFRPSRSLTRQALRDRTALLYDSRRDTLPAESVLGVRSVLCAPLFDGESALGAIYLERSTPFTEDHLQRLTAAAVLSAGALAGALRTANLAEENRRLQGAALGSGLVGESPALRRVSELIARAAPAASTVLVLGESGTGKEVAARALHAASPRAGGPFVAINCATLSETLLESELFGHEKGAFTGAVARKTGKLETARGGTLFLDEVGELPLSLQAKLLRVLQERSFERVGGTSPVAADFRLVAATNRDLAQAIAEGRFRADLFYRLNVIALTLPPLRERREDIPLLALHFAALHGRAIRGKPVAIATAARTLLQRYGWPGNVRELSNAIERAVVLGLSEEIEPGDLPETLLEAAPPAFGAAAEGVAPFHAAVNLYKRQLVQEALAASGGIVTRAAERLGLHPNHLHRLINSLDLRA